jgi:hypothetical protein
MASTDDVMKERAKRAYELGRVRRALRFGLFPLPLIAISTNICGAVLPSCLAGSLLVLSVIFFAWRGGSYEAAIRPGLASGMGAFLLPFAGELSGVCTGEKLFACASLCFLGGMITGGFLGARSMREELHHGRFLASGCVIASLVGSLGCVLAGLGGILGMILGVTTISIPAVLLLRRA